MNWKQESRWVSVIQVVDLSDFPIISLKWMVVPPPLLPQNKKKKRNKRKRKNKKELSVTGSWYKFQKTDSRELVIIHRHTPAQVGSASNLAIRMWSKTGFSSKIRTKNNLFNWQVMSCYLQFINTSTKVWTNFCRGFWSCIQVEETRIFAIDVCPPILSWKGLPFSLSSNDQLSRNM